MNFLPALTLALIAVAAPRDSMALDGSHAAAGIVRIPAAPGNAPPREPVALPLGIGLDAAYEPGKDFVLLDPPSPAEWERAAAAEAAMGCGKARREGFVRPLSAARRAELAASWRGHELGEGDWLWTTALRTPGAFGTRLHFETVDLGRAALTVWAWSGDTLIQRGPFEGRGPREGGSFWTASLPGETAFLEVRGGDAPPELELTEVVHYDRLPGGGVAQEKGPCGAPTLNGSHSCQPDVMCAGLQNGLDFARDATAQLRFMDNGQCFSCTGTLVNDLDPSTQVLYFITAFHCINTQAAADTLEAVWLFQRDSCNGTAPSWFALDRNCGATLLETSPDSGGSDLAFLRLDGELQPGVSFAGYTNSTAAGFLTGIHHPAGDLKAIATYSVSGLFTCTFAFDPLDYDALEANLGLTEGGSSGSGLFNNSGQLLGQLSGKCCEAWLGAECEDATCSNQADWRAAYGESEESWPIIQKWMESGGTLHVDASNTTPPWKGTPSDPYRTIAQALDAAWPGVRLLVYGGSYDEAATLTVQLDTTGGTVLIGD